MRPPVRGTPGKSQGARAHGRETEEAHLLRDEGFHGGRSSGRDPVPAVFRYGVPAGLGDRLRHGEAGGDDAQEGLHVGHQGDVGVGFFARRGAGVCDGAGDVDPIARYRADARLFECCGKLSSPQQWVV